VTTLVTSLNVVNDTRYMTVKYNQHYLHATSNVTQQNESYHSLDTNVMYNATMAL